MEDATQWLQEEGFSLLPPMQPSDLLMVRDAVKAEAVCLYWLLSSGDFIHWNISKDAEQMGTPFLIDDALECHSHHPPPSYLPGKMTLVPQEGRKSMSNSN